MSTIVDLACCVAALMFSVLLDQVHGQEKCGAALKLMNSYNGRFNNLDKIATGGPKETYVEEIFVPIQVPFLNAPYVFYFEEIVKNEFENVQLRVVTEDDAGVVKLTVYDITNKKFYKMPNELSTLDVSAITAQDIKLREDCSATYTLMPDGILFGYWVLCKGKKPYKTYANYVACDWYNFYVPPDAPEYSTAEPYTMVRKAPRYPVPGAPASCANICKNGTQPVN